MPRADGKVVLGAAVGAEDVCRVFDVDVLDGYGLWHCDLDVEAVVPAGKRCSGTVVLHGDQLYGAYVQEFEVAVGAKRDGESALSAGGGLSVVADLEEPSVGDGEAEAAAAVFAVVVSQGAAMWADVAVLGCFATGLGLCDAFESCRTSFLLSTGPRCRLPGS